MSFSGNVSRPSHEGGLLVSFEGRAPGLYTGIRVVGGKFLGRVDSVIGTKDKAFIHIKPLAEGVIATNAIGSPIEIAPRDRSPRNDQNNRSRGNDGQRGQDRRSFDRDVHMKPGDWRCSKCKNHNYANKQYCNRSTCNEKKPQGNNNNNSYSDNNRGRNDNNRGRNSNDGPNMKPGDWMCPKCKNHNYASKNFCNRSSCDEKKPQGNNNNNSYRDNNRGRNDNNRGRNSDDEPNMKPGDWMCPKCKNHNYASKNFCNRSSCDVRKPGGPDSAKGSRNTPARARRPDRRSTERQNNSSRSSRPPSNRQSTGRSGNRQSTSRPGNGRGPSRGRSDKKFNSRR
jgi:predicted nucleic-acid-binding Zn-ribbon protein/rRNA processing protein Gar1